MAKFDNYIYYTICEITIKHFETTHYTTYRNFCNVFRFSISEKKLSKNEEIWLTELSEQIELIFGIEGESAGKYIYDFFILELYIKFEPPVRGMKNAFPHSYQ